MLVNTDSSLRRTPNGAQSFDHMDIKDPAGRTALHYLCSSTYTQAADDNEGTKQGRLEYGRMIAALARVVCICRPDACILCRLKSV
jgi:hypothetical protein